MNVQYAFNACENGDLDALQKMNFTESEIEKCKKLCLPLACGNGHLKVAKWIVDKFHFSVHNIKRDDRNVALFVAVSNKHLNVTKWLLKIFDFAMDDVISTSNIMFCTACENEDFELVEYLVNTFTGSPFENERCKIYIDGFWKNLITNSCENQRTCLVLWLVVTFPRNEIPDACKDFVQTVMEMDTIMVKPAANSQF